MHHTNKMERKPRNKIEKTLDYLRAQNNKLWYNVNRLNGQNQALQEDLELLEQKYLTLESFVTKELLPRIVRIEHNN